MLTHTYIHSLLARPQTLALAAGTRSKSKLNAAELQCEALAISKCITLHFRPVPRARPLCDPRQVYRHSPESMVLKNRVNCGLILLAIWTLAVRSLCMCCVLFNRASWDGNEPGVCQTVWKSRRTRQTGRVYGLCSFAGMMGLVVFR